MYWARASLVQNSLLCTSVYHKTMISHHCHKGIHLNANATLAHKMSLGECRGGGLALLPLWLDGEHFTRENSNGHIMICTLK